MGLLIIPLLALLTLIAALSSNSEQSALDAQQHQAGVAAGGSLRIYANAVARFTHANPTFTGTAPRSALDLPAWFSPLLGTGNQIVAGRAFVFFIPTDTLPDLYRMFPEDEVGLPYQFGVARNGYLQSPSGGSSFLVLPAAIPEGSVVYVL
jgi:hypothetical protein